MALLADRIQRIGESATMRIAAKAQQLLARGVDVINLSIGEPDFPTPENIKNAGKKAIDENFTHYTANDGIPELKQAIIRKLQSDNGLDYKSDEIIVSSGAKNCLYNLCVALFNKDDEAIIPAPYWVSYPQMVSLAKGAPVIVRCSEENGFRLQPDNFARAITPRTKALFLNNPCNPTGSAYSKDELEAIVNIAVSENIVIIADEIYEKIVYDGFRFVSAASISDKARELTVIINGVSKAFSMTGWRLGYAAGPRELISGMSKVQGHNTSNACSISQKAAIEALTGSKIEVEKMTYEFQRRRNLALARVRATPDVSCFQPQGAFYLFPNLQAYLGREYDGNPIRNSYGLAYYLLKKAHVAVVPGDAFGLEGFIRISFATSTKRIEEGISRISQALAELSPPRRVGRKTLSNAITKRRDFVEMEPSINLGMRDALAAESEAFLSHDTYYEWNVNIGGVVLQLRTNSPHLNDFWIENFYPAELEGDIEPHAIIYAVNWITGREPRAYYNPESHTAFIFKSAYYAQLRHVALGIVSDISEKLYNTLAVDAACFATDGGGTLLFFPPATDKLFHIAGLLKHGDTKIVSHDLVFVRLSGQNINAACVERKFYMHTKFVENFSAAKPLFERSKCENVVTEKDACLNSSCGYIDDCDIDRGEPYCFSASQNSMAMLDPYWIGGPSKHAKRTVIKTVIIFKKDNFGPLCEKLSPEQALRILEEGRPPAQAVSEPSRPFYNHYMLGKTSERIEQQKLTYKRILEKCNSFLVNSDAAKPEEVQKIIQAIISNQGNEVFR